MLLFALACEPSPEPQDTEAPPPSTGQLALRFAIDSDWLDAMQEPAIGRFWGSFWRGSEVTGAGPDEGAVDLGGIYVESVDLQSGQATDVLFTSEDLPAEEVVVLGFLDSDRNADTAAPDPDAKDPVTLPADNDFDVVGGETTEVEVFFGLLNP